MNEIDRKELDTILRLLDEPNPDSWELIRNRIISYGIEVVPVLEEHWNNTFDPLIQSRLEDVIQYMQHQYVYAELNNWVHFGNHDLLGGALLLTRFLYAETDVLQYTRIVGGLVQDVWLEMNNSMTGLDKVKVLNHILFDVHHFKVNKTLEPGMFDPGFTAFIDRKKGSPLAMSILFLMIAQSLKMPVYGVALPGQLILAYTFEPEGGEIPEQRKVIFYINPAQEGLVFQRRDIERFLTSSGLPIDKESYYAPCSNVHVVRLLAKAYLFDLQARSESEKAAKLEELIRALF